MNESRRRQIRPAEPPDWRFPLLVGVFGLFCSVNLPAAVPAVMGDGKPGTFTTLVITESKGRNHERYELIGTFSSDDKTVQITGAILEEPYSARPADNFSVRAFYSGTQHVSLHDNGGFLAFATIVGSVIGLLGWIAFVWCIAQRLRPQ